MNWMIFVALFVGFLLGVFFMALLAMAREGGREERSGKSEESPLRPVLSEKDEPPPREDAQEKNRA